MSPSTALLAPLRTARRSRFEATNQFEPPTNTPFASPREAQSSGAQCEGGWADASGLTIAFDIVHLLLSAQSNRMPSRYVRESAERADPSSSFRRGGDGTVLRRLALTGMHVSRRQQADGHLAAGTKRRVSLPFIHPGCSWEDDERLAVGCTGLHSLSEAAD
jgi:hypothetical protein